MPPRTASLDQFRGYTVLGMFIVNFLGEFRVKVVFQEWGRLVPPLLLYLAICYGCVRLLEWKCIYWRM